MGKLYDYNKIKKTMGKAVFKNTDNDTEYTGLFIDVRIDPNTVPGGKFIYYCRHESGDWIIPVTIEPCVVVDFCGTFITDTEIKFPNENNKCINIDIIQW